MKINPVQPIQFGYTNILKKKYLSGELPLEKGFYGGQLFKDGKKTNCTVEHLKPRCDGGKNKLSNIVLATFENNNKRWCYPLTWFLNEEAMEQYLKAIDDANIPELKNYSKVIRQTVAQILEEEAKQGIGLKLNTLI